ncbi:MAG: hypothetical protein HFJ06_17110 [Lachnospiraceae bacterium]|nr:hypothetical protein [Lachnospiraceae bacterium]
MRATVTMITICIAIMALSGCGDSDAAAPLEENASLVSVDWTGGVSIPASDMITPVPESSSDSPESISLPSVTAPNSAVTSVLPAESTDIPASVAANSRPSEQAIADALVRLKNMYDQECAKVRQSYADRIAQQTRSLEDAREQVEMGESDLARLRQQAKDELARLEQAGHQNTQTYRLAKDWYDVQLSEAGIAQEEKINHRDSMQDALDETQKALDEALQRLNEWYVSEYNRIKAL